MRKIVMFNRITLNGYFAGPEGEIDWFIHDPEVDRALHASMDADTMLLQDGLVDEARKMKGDEGGDIVIFGSGTVVKQLTDAGLIDEHLIVVTPVILESGIPLFEDIRREDLKLIDAKGFSTGNVLLHYRVLHPGD